jgi:hypothetical protein
VWAMGMGISGRFEVLYVLGKWSKWPQVSDSLLM